MRRLSRLLTMSWPERRLLFQAALVVSVIRVGLWLLPFGTMERALGALGGPPTTRRRGRAVPADAVALAVSRVAARVPGATCLTQALAARLLLARRGYPARLCVGFGRPIGGDLEGHAWVESDGRVVLGGDLAGYERLPRPGVAAR